MPQISSESNSRLLRSVAAIMIALPLVACASGREITGSTRSASAPLSDSGKPIENMTASELADATRRYGAAYEKNPKDRAIGLNYANVLRMTGRNAQSLAVMQQIAISYPNDREVLAAYGKAQAGAGQLDEALATIRRAQTPDMPDWRLVSAEGAVLDQLGRANEARRRYNDALQIQPNEPSILSNLGMSYLLTGDLKSAESYLRSAMAQPAADSRVRQNYSLVIGLQGRFAEAEKIARQELSPQQADANLAYLRSMLSQQNAWQALAQKDKPQAGG
ncbi:tetratricopeptide repeat protein [Rhizobiaceae bacterium BDR2-2]|uniref:Tetratricopeptide repeat protein n=1 Tax=Ectorhizobium quercum TaxID=2965071 RepID=A0AAE3STH5_9HYPH|nr:tetratricopeptide repeat protein [Ectorhizobium quercum]MCX8995693.1 tetratricopeptide repeat protein [Ectorhizobium quercum]